jgi:hypothetical protein
MVQISLPYNRRGRASALYTFNLIKDFTEVTIIALKEKPKATKCSEHGTINTITYTAKIVVKILRRSIETKIEAVFEEAHFGFR